MTGGCKLHLGSSVWPIKNIEFLSHCVLDTLNIFYPGAASTGKAGRGKIYCNFVLVAPFFPLFSCYYRYVVIVASRWYSFYFVILGDFDENISVVLWDKISACF